jgi:hypothetical protein
LFGDLTKSDYKKTIKYDIYAWSIVYNNIIYITSSVNL